MRGVVSLKQCSYFIYDSNFAQTCSSCLAFWLVRFCVLKSLFVLRDRGKPQPFFQSHFAMLNSFFPVSIWTVGWLAGVACKGFSLLLHIGREWIVVGMLVKAYLCIAW